MADETTTTSEKPKKANTARKASSATKTASKPRKTAASAAAAAATAAAAAEASAQSTAGTGSAFDFKAMSEEAMAQASQWTEAAATAARTAATTAKETTGSAMQNLARFISETAATVDDKVGPQYGDYARNAADAVGKAAESLNAKDVDQIVEDAREFVKKSPAVAIGAAAVVGFILMRLAKGSGSKDA